MIEIIKANHATDEEKDYIIHPCSRSRATSIARGQRHSFRTTATGLSSAFYREKVKVRFSLQHRAWHKDSKRMRRQNDLVWEEVD